MNRFILMLGQSNTRGVSSGPPVGDYSSLGIRFFRHNTGTTNGTNDHIDDALTTLQVTNTPTPNHGLELQLGLDLVAGGWTGSDITICKCSIGGQLLTAWKFDGTSAGSAKLVSSIALTRPQGPTRYYVIVNQGENEAVAGAETDALAWAGRMRRIRANLSSLFGARVYLLGIQTRNPITGASWEPTVQAQQLAACDDVVNIDDTTDVGDGLHTNSAGQNTSGSRAAVKLLAA